MGSGVMEPTYAFDYTVIAWFLIVGVAFVIVTLAAVAAAAAPQARAR